jgi:hypothetical protein
MLSTREAAQTETLRVKVGNVADATRSYARLGLRVLRRSSGCAVLELPSGMQIVLYQSVTRGAQPARG